MIRSAYSRSAVHSKMQLWLNGNIFLLFLKMRKFETQRACNKILHASDDTETFHVMVVLHLPNYFHHDQRLQVYVLWVFLKSCGEHHYCVRLEGVFIFLQAGHCAKRVEAVMVKVVL